MEEVVILVNLKYCYVLYWMLDLRVIFLGVLLDEIRDKFFFSMYKLLIKLVRYLKVFFGKIFICLFLILFWKMYLDKILSLKNFKKYWVIWGEIFYLDNLFSILKFVVLKMFEFKI